MSDNDQHRPAVRSDALSGMAGATHDLADETYEIELLSPARVADPYPIYEQLRQLGPVVEVPEHHLWLVTNYAGCLEVLGDPERFSSTEALSGRHLFRDNPCAAQMLRESPGYPRKRTLILSDPPEHTRFRRIVQKAFAPAKRIRALTPMIESYVDELIDGFIDRGRCEFVEEFAVPLPIGVLASILGVPKDMQPSLKRWSDDFIASQAGNVDSERVMESARSTIEFERYMSAELDRRAAAPDLEEHGDFLSRLIIESRNSDAAPLERREELSILQQMLVGGNETTTNMLGNAMAELIRNPDQMDALRRDPSTIPDFLEEVLRFRSPLQGLYRTTTRDTTIQGVEVPGGAKLMVLFASANRDEQIYTEPGFCPARDNRSNPHLAFGRGTHACMGQGLSRKEGAIAFEHLLRRLDGIALAPDGRPAQPVELFGFHGQRAMEIRFERAAVPAASTS